MKLTGGNIHSDLDKILKSTDEETIQTLLSYAYEYELFKVTELKLNKKEIIVGIIPFLSKLSDYQTQLVLNLLKAAYNNTKGGK